MNIYLDEFLPKISTEFLIKSRWNMDKKWDAVKMVETWNVGHIPSRMVALLRLRLQQGQLRHHQHVRRPLRLQAVPVMPNLSMQFEWDHGKNVAVITAVIRSMLSSDFSLHILKFKQNIGWNMVGKLVRIQTWCWPQFRPCNLAFLTTTAHLCMLLGFQWAYPSTSEGNPAHCYWAVEWASDPVC